MITTSELETNLDTLGRLFIRKRKKLAHQSKVALSEVEKMADTQNLKFKTAQIQMYELERLLKEESDRCANLLKVNSITGKEIEIGKERMKELYNQSITNKANLKLLYNKCLLFKKKLENESKTNNLLKSESSNLTIQLNLLKSELNDCSGDNELLKEKQQDLKGKLDSALESEEWLEIIEKLLSAESQPSEIIGKFNQLIEKDFIKASNKVSSLAEEAEVYCELQAISRDLSLVSQFSGIKDKSILVIAGGFSSGKSQFLNSLSEGYSKRTSGEYTHLKVGTTPTTAIPTYVRACHNSKSDYVTAYTAHGGSVEISREQYHKLTHNYVKKARFDIRSIMPYTSIAYPMKIKRSEHINFVDTPGIDASETGITGNDKDTTENFVKQATALLWFIGIKNTGTMSSSDLGFLRKVQDSRPDLPFYLVANQCDTRSKDQIEEILDCFEEDLNDHSIEYSGISAYSSFDGKEYQSRKVSIWKFIESCNNKHLIQEDLEKRLASVFGRYQLSFRDEKEKNEQVVREINNLSMTILSTTGNMELEEKLRPHIKKLEVLVKKESVDQLVKDFSKLYDEMLECIDGIFSPQASLTSSASEPKHFFANLFDQWFKPS